MEVLRTLSSRWNHNGQRFGGEFLLEHSDGRHLITVRSYDVGVIVQIVKCVPQQVDGNVDVSLLLGRMLPTTRAGSAISPLVDKMTGMDGHALQLLGTYEGVMAGCLAGTGWVASGAPSDPNQPLRTLGYQYVRKFPVADPFEMGLTKAVYCVVQIEPVDEEGCANFFYGDLIGVVQTATSVASTRSGSPPSTSPAPAGVSICGSSVQYIQYIGLC